MIFFFFYFYFQIMWHSITQDKARYYFNRKFKSTKSQLCRISSDSSEFTALSLGPKVRFCSWPHEGLVRPCLKVPVGRGGPWEAGLQRPGTAGTAVARGDRLQGISDLMKVPRRAEEIVGSDNDRFCITQSFASLLAWNHWGASCWGGL